MKKYLFLFVCLFISITSANAQSNNSCINLTSDMQITSSDASTDGQVTFLQTFLKSKKYLKSEPTGYFGLLTEDAVKKFQALNDIKSVPGKVGESTRLYINNLSCDSSIVTKSDDPTITIKAKSRSNNSESSLTVKKGSKVTFSGKPKNLSRSDDGFGGDGYGGWYYGSILENSCGNNSPKYNNTWKLNCVANTVGTAEIYTKLYKNGQKFNSNIITLNVIEDTDVKKPKITFSSDPKKIITDGKPGAVTLTWKSENTDYCIFEDQKVGVSGSVYKYPINKSTKYTISCGGKGGVVEKKIDVNFKYSWDYLGLNCKDTSEKNNCEQ